MATHTITVTEVQKKFIATVLHASVQQMEAAALEAYAKVKRNSPIADPREEGFYLERARLSKEALALFVEPELPEVEDEDAEEEESIFADEEEEED